MGWGIRVNQVIDFSIYRKMDQ